MPLTLPADLTWISFLVIAAAITLAYLVFGATGFGSSIISVPIVAHLLPLTFVIPLITAVDLAAVSAASIGQWRQADWREIRRLVVPMALGVALGSTLLVNLPRNVALIALGLFVMAQSAWTLRGARRWQSIRPAWSIPTGVIGGVFSALFGTGGALYMTYLSSRIEDKTTLRATSSMIIATAVILRVLVFLVTPLWLQPGMLLMIVVPLVMSSLILGIAGIGDIWWSIWTILGGVGTTGVPSGSIPFIIGILAAIGVDPGLIAIVLGVDRILDMCRTTLNVAGDLTAATYITRIEAAAGHAAHAV